MSTKAMRKPKHKSVTKAESSVTLEHTIKPSDEYLQIFKSTFMFSRNRSQFNKHQIETINTKMDKLYNKIINSRKANLNNIVTLAYSHQNMCHAYMGSDQIKLDVAKNFILHCLNLIRDKELDPKTILIALKAYNHLGDIFYKQEKTEKAILMYDKAVELYLAYTQENEEHGCPIDLEDIINESPAKVSGYGKLKNIYMFILQALIQLYYKMVPTSNHNLMRYSHLFLAAELSKLPETKTYLEWIVNAMTVCNYLLKYNRFEEARSHLNAAIYVKKVFIDEKYNNMKEKESSPAVYELNKQKETAIYYINEYRVQYGLAVLRKSAKRLLLEKGEDSESINLKSKYPTKSKERVSRKLLLIDEIEKGNPIPSECQPMTIQYISNYTDAYATFIVVLRYLYYRRLLFSADKDATIYTQFTLDTCNAYKYMALYEKNTIGRMLLQHQRKEIFSDAIKVIGSRNPNMLKYLRLQLAIAYSPLIEMKFDQLEAAYSLYIPQRHDAIIFEIKRLVENALINLQMYMRTL